MELKMYYKLFLLINGDLKSLCDLLTQPKILHALMSIRNILKTTGGAYLSFAVSCVLKDSFLTKF